MVDQVRAFASEDSLESVFGASACMSRQSGSGRFGSSSEC